MKRLSARPEAWMTAALLLLGAGTARADYLNWSYKWQVTGGPTFTTGNSNISVALSPAGTTGADTLPVAAITASSSALGTDSFDAPYNLKLSITDNANNASGTLTWNGMLSGTVGPSSSTLQNSFSTPTESISLGGHNYQVTLDPNPLSVPSPSSNARALLDANIVVSASMPGTGNGGGGSNGGGGGSGGIVGHTPEPSSLVLAASALSLAGLGRWRRRSRAAAVAGV